MKVVLRADANEQIGWGHLVRSRALAEALADRGADCTLLTRAVGDLGAAELPIPEADSAEDEFRAIADLSPSVLVTDLYRPDPAKLRALAEGPWAVVSIDDENDLLFDCELLVNPSLSRQLVHRHTPRTRYLSGGRFILLRSPFCRAATRHARPSLQRIIVCFGGSDPAQMTSRVTGWLSRCVPTSVEKIEVVLGPGFTGTLTELRDERFHVVRNVPDMMQRMADADLGVLAAGTLLYEAAAVGLPSLFISMTPAQAREGTAAQENGAGIHVGLHDDVVESRFAEALSALAAADARTLMAAAQQQLVDGCGCLRVAEEILGLHRGGS